MTLFNLTTSNLILTAKPQNVAATKNSVVNQSSLTLEQISELVLQSPYNTSLATGTTTNSWVSQQLFALDFDSGFTHHQLIERLTQYDLVANIIYSTFSDTPELRKFRVIFALDDPITDIFYAKEILKGLLKLFPEADRQCSDPCRMYYPGKELLGINEELNVSNYFESVCISAAGGSSDRYHEKFTINRRNNYTKNVVLPDTITNFDWTKVEELTLLKRFFNEDVRLSYNILFGLATNMQFIEGGLKRVFDRMQVINRNGGGIYIPEYNGRFEKYPGNYFTMVKTIRKWNYMPTRLDSFDPWSNEHEYHNVLSLSSQKKGHIEIIEPQDMISLVDGERVMLDTFTKSINSIPFKIDYSKVQTQDMFGVTHSLTIPNVNTDVLFDNITIDSNDIYIFKLPTGIGKTQLLETIDDSLIALPFHHLKDEVSARMKVSHLVTPAYSQYSQPAINDRLKLYQECDLFTEASNLIKSIAVDKCFIDGIKLVLTPEDINMASEFILQNEACRASKSTVLTTHTRALYDSSFKHKTIIFDEDPLNNLIDINYCDLDFSIFDNTAFASFIADVEVWLRVTLGMSYIGHIPKFNIPTGFREFCAMVKKSSVIKLLESKYVYKDPHDVTRVAFCRVKELPKDRRIYIMSATVPIQIYKALYGKRVKVVDITNIEHIGHVEQWTNRSFSMSGMVGKKRYQPKVYEEVFNIISGQPVITHLGARQLFKNNWSKFYFGNCSGGDELNGQDIAVIGTPNKPQYVYMFYAELLGVSNNTDFELSDQLIEWNGFRFRFFTFRDETVRSIQLSLIESELLQACGRNRTLRKICKTNLFSSLPLRITKKFNTK